MTASLETAPEEDVRRWRRALLLRIVVVPLLIAALGCLVLLVTIPALPGTVVLHWGVGGTRSGSPYTALLCLPITALMSGVLWIALRQPANVRRTAVSRLLFGVPVWLACFLSIGLVGSVVLQAHAGAPVPSVPLAVGFVAGAVAGGAAGLLMPEPPAQPAPPAVRSLLPVRAGERLVWLGCASTAPALEAAVLGVLGTAVVVLVVAGLVVEPRAALVAILPALVLVVVASLLRWRVRVDARGVTAVGAVGFPVVRVPIAEVARADVIAVAPLGDYGGLGLRHRTGVTAVATRGGEALQVTLRDGRRLVLTVDDAATAAGVLKALRS